MTMIEGWKCGECGVIYAPFIKECRCSVKISVNDSTCFHSYTEGRCTKCGLLMSGITFTEAQDQTVCQHTWSESGQSTAGRHCLNCGASEPLFSSTKVTISDLPEGMIRKT